MKSEIDEKEAATLVNMILAEDPNALDFKDWRRIHTQARQCAGGVMLPIKWDTPLRPVNDCPEHDADSKLLGVLDIAGTLHHIEAWEVREVSDDGAILQEAVCPEMCSYDELTTHMTEGAGATVQINGREYFVVVTPFQN